MAGEKATISIISLLVSLITLASVLYLVLLMPANDKARDYDVQKKLAGELSDNNLHEASVEEYKKILADPGLDAETGAGINYLIARIYFENLLDYEKAAAHYIRARSLNPQGSFYDEAGKNLIACLEKMGRLVDAKRELDKAVDLDSVYAAHEGETMVAKIGDVPVFLSDLDNEIQNLPLKTQQQFLGKEGKMEFLNQYIGLELMYRAAVRAGLDADRDVVKKKKSLEKHILIEKYIAEHVVPEINIDTSDVKNYYLANKDEKYGGKTYDEIRTQVFIDYQQEKAQQAFNDYIAKLAAVENVQIFAENIK
jgi:tetratricopeptide (TPR) repeat protein